MLLVLAAPGAGQAFVVDNSVIPFNGGSTENVDFGDVDLDGDWDVLLAKVTDRIWINLGGLQGLTIGVFRDETFLRLPPDPGDDSHDVELADIDGDGDLDLYFANNTDFLPDGSTWLVNVGGKQGGALGYYVDETAERWVGLGEPGSSIPPGLIQPNGGWEDFSEDGDFADFDNDGDLDLVHVTDGNPCSLVSGNAPTRIFLNNGDGYFQEFNPSLFMPSCGTLAPGEPGLWCEGVYAPQTADVTGAFSDVTVVGQDGDVGDLDGDFDLDLILSDGKWRPRAFANRLEGSGLAPSFGGALAFRDVTGVVLPLPEDYMILNDQHSTHTLGDLDRDGDLDLLGVDWYVLTSGCTAPDVFCDIFLENSGDGLFGGWTVAAETWPASDEADFLDFDNDGDLDEFLGNSFMNQLFRNDGGFVFTNVPLPPFDTVTFDAEAADTDGDGDYDLLVGEWLSPDEDVFLRNVTQVPDTHAPYLPNVEAVGDQTASPTDLPVRAHVYDNAPYYITWYNDTVLEVSVDGVSLPSIQAQSSMGQIFRAELPGNLVGSVDYRFVSSDEYGNTGASAVQSYAATSGSTHAVPYGQGTVGMLGGTEPTIAALSVPFGGSTLYLAGHSDAPPGTAGFLVVGGNEQDPPQLIFGIILANVEQPFHLIEPVATDANGNAVVAIDVPPVGPSFKVYAQFGAFDPPSTGEALSASKGLELITQ